MPGTATSARSAPSAPLQTRATSFSRALVVAASALLLPPPPPPPLLLLSPPPLVEGTDAAMKEAELGIATALMSRSTAPRRCSSRPTRLRCSAEAKPPDEDEEEEEEEEEEEDDESVPPDDCACDDW